MAEVPQSAQVIVTCWYVALLGLLLVCVFCVVDVLQFVLLAQLLSCTIKSKNSQSCTNNIGLDSHANHAGCKNPRARIPEGDIIIVLDIIIPARGVAAIP